MDREAPRQRIPVRRILVELVLLSVVMYILKRTFEQIEWQRLVTHSPLAWSLTMRIVWLIVPLCMAIDAYLARILDA